MVLWTVARVQILLYRMGEEHMIEYDFEGYAKSKIDKGLRYLEGFSKGYHQAKSEWVELTEYEIKGVLGLSESWVGEDCSIPDMIGFAKAIESKLKEKNT